METIAKKTVEPIGYINRTDVCCKKWRSAQRVLIKVGDASHPQAVEVLSLYPDWAERNERLLEDVRGSLHQGLYEKNHSTKPGYGT
jgi:hypothetical protein